MAQSMTKEQIKAQLNLPKNTSHTTVNPAMREAFDKALGREKEK